MPAAELERLLFPSRVDRERAAAALFRQERRPRSLRRRGRGAVAALTPGKKTRWTQPATRATRARRGPDGGDDARAAREQVAAAQLRHRAPRAPRAARGSELQEPARPHQRAADRSARRAAARRDSPASRSGYGSSAKSSPRKRRSKRAAANGVLEPGAGLLDQHVVADARRARRHACHAAEAAVEVARDLRVDHASLPSAQAAHEVDAAARRVHLLAPRTATSDSAGRQNPQCTQSS